MPTLIPDTARIVVVVLFFLMVGQAGAIVVYYTKVRRVLAKHHHGGLLPLHVILVSVALICFGAEAVATNYQRVTQPATFWLWFNVALFTVTNYGLLLVLRYERRRFRRSRVLV